MLFRSHSKLEQNVNCSGLICTLPVIAIVTLSWRGQTFVVIRRIGYEQQRYKFDEDIFSGIGAACIKTESDQFMSATKPLDLQDVLDR